MAAIFDMGNEYEFEVRSYTGQRGDIVIPIYTREDEDAPCTFITMTVFEAAELITSLKETVSEFKKKLSEIPEEE